MSQEPTLPRVLAWCRVIGSQLRRTQYALANLLFLAGNTLTADWKYKGKVDS